MIDIELIEPSLSTCECCDKKTTNLTRFVYKDDAAFAVYYAAFSDSHPDEGVIGIISLGDWDKDDLPPTRVAFAFRLWRDEDDYKVTITDADKSSWNDVEILGRKLTREEALKHPWIEGVFHITDHMTIDDDEIKAYFEGETIH